MKGAEIVFHIREGKDAARPWHKVLCGASVPIGYSLFRFAEQATCERCKALAPSTPEKLETPHAK